MKTSLDKEITVYCVLSEYNEALINDGVCDYYLTLQDLYECEGVVPHVELKTKEWLELDSNVIDLNLLNLN